MSFINIDFPKDSLRVVCTRDQWECKSSKLCISAANRCDTITQCHDRSDEMFCPCPSDKYLTEQFFDRCTSTNQCLPKDLPCELKQQCNPTDGEEEDQSCPLFMYRPCSNNDTCEGENQYCREFFPRKYCVCLNGYRMNETTGICEDINECRERVVCDHYCINTLGSYRCACQENYHLQSDKHTCTPRNEHSSWIYGLFNHGIYRMNINKENELVTSNDHAYLIDYDPVMQELYYAECTVPIRPVLMTCANTTGIFRIHLNQSKLIIDGRAYPSIYSMAIDWLHRNIYFVNMRSQTIEVCRLNGSFCRVLLRQTISDYFPQRIVLYPEKGYVSIFAENFLDMISPFRFLFYTAVVKSRAQHILRLGMDGTNLKLLFTSPIMHDLENVNYLRPLLTIDRINHHLYFYNGLDKIYILNMHGDILHTQYQMNDVFHAFKVFGNRIYKAFRNQSELHIHPKYALWTTTSGSKCLFAHRSL